MHSERRAQHLHSPGRLGARVPECPDPPVPFQLIKQPVIVGGDLPARAMLRGRLPKVSRKHRPRPVFQMTPGLAPAGLHWFVDYFRWDDYSCYRPILIRTDVVSNTVNHFLMPRTIWNPADVHTNCGFNATAGCSCTLRRSRIGSTHSTIGSLSQLMILNEPYVSPFSCASFMANVEVAPGAI